MPPVYRNNKQKKGDGKNEKQDIGRKIASGPVCQHSRYGAGDQSAQRIGELVIFQYCGVISHLAEIGGHNGKTHRGQRKPHTEKKKGDSEQKAAGLRRETAEQLADTKKQAK